ncbi:MAG: uroporphyrinogen decarboxylase family protein [Burkholderiales bacterium]|nr:uroporphyrinogen decarboxylase family protein [Burkholderiales bacterium]
MNHWRRIEAAIAGEAADRVPVALWRHFPEDDQDPARLAARTVEFQRAFDFDLVKFMPSGTYGVEDWGARTAWRGAANGAREVLEPAVKRPEDWRKLARLDARRGALGAQNEALALAAKALGGTAPILQTVFSPLTTARKLAGEALLAHLREAPDAVEEGLAVIAEVTIEFGRAALEAGADGFFFATQLATTEVLTVAEYERFGVRYDLAFFEALGDRARFNLLHLHGERPMFERLARYPVQMINWHDRLAAPSLAEARQSFRGALVGGIDERGLLVRGSAAEVRAQARDAIAQTGGRGFVLGPGCVVAIEAPEGNIRAVVEEARRPL